MRLKTKLVVFAAGLTCAIVVVLSALFLSELLRQRVSQTAASNDVLAHEVLLMTRQAVELGLRAHPPADASDDAVHVAVTDALRSHQALNDLMNAIVRYSPTVQDVSVTDAHGLTLISTDPDALDQATAFRTSFARVRDGGVAYQARQVFGRPRVLDVAVPLDRNGMPFLVVHVGVRSSFLKSTYAPSLKNALLYALLAAVASMAAAGLLANLALRPIEAISERLERLTIAEGGPVTPRIEASTGDNDAVVRVTQTIERLDRQMRSKEAGYTALRTNLNQMLDTLRDGVLLFSAEGRVVMASDAVDNFLGRTGDAIVGKRVEEIFEAAGGLGTAVMAALATHRQVAAESVTTEDGRKVQISVDRIDDGRGDGASIGTLVTLRDKESAQQIEQEMEVSRRLAAIGRLTAGVGHEVKNPINAMVVHLELLRGKLAADQNNSGAQRHVEILASEMQRLDRVVQTLADFSRPMELSLREHDLGGVVGEVLDLTGGQMQEMGIRAEKHLLPSPLMVRVDGELMRQALLNIVLNGMQAMPSGGLLRVSVRKDRNNAIVDVTDTGTGIPAEMLPRIFDLYFTTKASGSGIGLSMTYRIVQLHGGVLEVRSNPDPGSPDRGTTFTVCLPLSMAGAADSASHPNGHRMSVEGRI